MARAHSLVRGDADPDELYPLVPKQFGGSDFLPAPDLEDIAHALLEEYRDRFRFMRDFTLRVLWKAKGGASGGKATLGKLVKPSGLAKFYAAADFVIWLAADVVESYGMTRWQIEAALFHELLHATYEENEETHEKRPTWQEHDIEAFDDEILEYGAWKSELQTAAKAFLQMEMDLSEPAPSTAASVAEAVVDEVAAHGAEHFASTLAGGDIDEISFSAGGKTATIRRPAGTK